MVVKSDFINEIKERGFIYQEADLEELDRKMSKESISGYIGFDITSDSLHIGSLVQLMLLHWLDYYNQVWKPQHIKKLLKQKLESQNINQLENWWFDNLTQKKIKYFCDHLCRYENDKIKVFKKILKEIR